MLALIDMTDHQEQGNLILPASQDQVLAGKRVGVQKTNILSDFENMGRFHQFFSASKNERNLVRRLADPQALLQGDFCVRLNPWRSTTA